MATDISLGSPVKGVTGIGPARAAALMELGVKNVGQLIAHLPMRHEQLEAESTIGALVPGVEGSARGEITATRVVRRGMPRFEAVLVDHTGRLDLVWFHGLYLHGSITPGVRLRVQGKAAQRGPMLQMANPKHDIIPAEGRGGEPEMRQERLRPVYPASAAITSEQIEKAIEAVLPVALKLIDDHLPAAFRKEHNLPELAEAYRMMHRPESEAEVKAARRRLAYDELLMLQLALAWKRAHAARTTRAKALKWSPAADERIRKRLPFTLTGAQDKVVKEIATDLKTDRPANRLIQGDVGSGKTAVALYGLLMAVANGAQGAMMAPTELLAEQHFANIKGLLGGSDVRVELLSGSLAAAERQRVSRGLETGDVDIVVGTHAVIGEKVKFKELAVVVIDEQHRFGVHQRLALRDKGGKGSVSPHVLVMTATPIPRTLAMTVLGDLDISTIDQLPPGRKKIITRVVDPVKEEEVYAYARKRLDTGEQAYVVAPAIESEEGLFDGNTPPLPGTKPMTIKEVMAKLEKGAMAGKRLAMMHGQMDREERDAIMQAFRAGKIDVLVATTVIEVGVDVPNATMMIVQDADRFGLATLHQLRGRIGRGSKGGLCVLIGKGWGEHTVQANERLAVMAQTGDGFKIAQRDVEIRGFGDVIGVRQSGMPPFKVADLSKDLELLTMARRDAVAWVGRSPELSTPEEKLLRSRLLKQHGKWLGLADVG